MRLVAKPGFSVSKNPAIQPHSSSQNKATDSFTRSKKLPVIEGHPVKISFSGLKFSGAQRKIMTYNAENFFRTKKGKSMKRPEGTQALADVILKEAPDVIAFQEVGSKSFLEQFNKKYLNEQYPNVIIFDLPELGRGIQVAIMSKKDIKVVDSKSHFKAICNEKKNQPCNHRDYLEATFETPTGYKFTVYNGHFKSMRGGEKQTMPKRMAEASGAAKVIREHLRRNAKANIVVAGDLNTIYNSPYGKPVIDRISLADDDDPTNDLAEVMLKDNRSEPTYRGGGRYEPKKLDYMFLSPNMQQQQIKTYVSGSFSQAPWIKASDHHPLVTVIEEPDNLGVKGKSLNTVA